MLLSSLIKGLKVIFVKGNTNIEISSISQNANEENKNGLFLCYKGVNFDGHLAINKAIENGAVALVVERYIQNVKLPQVIVKNTRKIMHKICNRFFNNPLKKIKVIGITGTNGKTTTCNILKQILESANKKVGLIGTNGIEFDSKITTSNLTTPDTVVLFKTFSEMAKSNIEYVVMEVSAHALDLFKVKGIKFEIGAFTNLTQDHLDYFSSMHKYALAKLKFLNKSYCKKCVINTDDSYGRLFYKLCNTNKTSYGIDETSENFAINLDLQLNYSKFILNVFDNIFDVKTNFLCKFNVYNILCAVVCSKLLGIDNDIIFKTISSLKMVDGRMNLFNLKTQAKAVIDFAHTPDGLEKVLSGIRNLNKNSRLITVFGCGGNRDKNKRALMGEIAYKLSDIVLLTSDNPRNENPINIINNILAGIPCRNKVVIEGNRKKAIRKAVEISTKNDIILLLGKGSEQTQEINGVKYVYSDIEEIKQYIKKI